MIFESNFNKLSPAAPLKRRQINIGSVYLPILSIPDIMFRIPFPLLSECIIFRI